MAMMLPLIASGASLLGGASSGKKQSQAQSQAAQAAQQSAAGQTAIDQELVNMYNNLYQNYQQNYQPLSGPASGAFSQLLSGTAAGGGQANVVSQDISSLTNPTTAAEGAGLDPSLVRNLLNSIVQPTTNAQDILPQVLSYLTNPQGTNLAKLTPGAESYLTAPGATNLATTAPQAEALYAQMAQMGLDPNAVKDFISQAVGTQDTNTQQQISSILKNPNALANPSGTVADIARSGFSADSSTLASLVPQLLTANQQAKVTGAQGLTSTASGLDAQTLQMLTTALSSAGGLDAQTAQMLTGALSSGGTVDAQTLQRIETAFGMQSGTLQQYISNLGTATGTTSNIDQLLQGFIGSGNPLAGAATSGLAGIGQQYAAAGSQAATNLQQNASANPFASFANTVGSFNWNAGAPSTRAAPTTTGTGTVPSAAFGIS